MWTDKSKFGAIAICSLALAACGTTGMNSSTGVASAPPVTTTAATASNVSGMGVVQSIDVVPRQQAGIGLGTVAGAAVGGLLGNQVGGGSGRTAATVAGAAGGALAGHQMEKNARGADQAYRITVRMDDGSLQTLAQETAPQVAAGDRVRLANGVIVERFR
ncbi:glycine zipper 2TM domain-containing protein [Noviherbaspirillum sp. UKPF54]|uniref:glycine zipper 2TM domain-containing protein n=1 Tax=Noviherbaspirillum sp. UKPF54 TaxID=2601898 RepID=UPI0011B1B445|nr:glycine zipper 2TM domain-containing protein [Noviherbaspirillum sp. UKPF54]QDZ27050.1 glycine zipper 2TM domain-containing protein [Noviherbaspirillum sp. UKPF54]